MTTKRHAICGSQNHPLSLLVPAGQVSGDTGRCWADWLLGDRSMMPDGSGKPCKRNRALAEG